MRNEIISIFKNKSSFLSSFENFYRIYLTDIITTENHHDENIFIDFKIFNNSNNRNRVGRMLIYIWITILSFFFPWIYLLKNLNLKFKLDLIKFKLI